MLSFVYSDYSSNVVMPKRCVAANYSDTITETVSLFRFPRYVARRRQWVLQVKRTRARWDFPVVYNASCVLTISRPIDSIHLRR